MKAKDQVTFYDAINCMDLESLKKVRDILMKKNMTDSNISKLNLVDIAIEEKHRCEEYHNKL